MVSRALQVRTPQGCTDRCCQTKSKVISIIRLTIEQICFILCIIVFVQTQKGEFLLYEKQ
jgi:hypothetical protein